MLRAKASALPPLLLFLVAVVVLAGRGIPPRASASASASSSSSGHGAWEQQLAGGGADGVYASSGALRDGGG